MKDLSNRILIIHTDGNTFNNPSLKCIIDLLIDKGYKIDLRYPKSPAPMPPNENIRFLPYGKLLKYIKHLFFDRYCSKILMYLIIIIEYFFYYGKYELIIGVDRQGLLDADLINSLNKTPYIFISFEIMFKSETSLKYKSLEKRAAKNITNWIIQDDVRAKQLIHENSLDNSNKILLPLASSGLGVTSEKRLRDQLNIPKNLNVAIMIGSVGGWSMASDVIRNVKNWPENWVLIVHERYGRTREFLADEFLEMKRYLNTKIFISDYATENVDEMSSILSGINAGIAFYQPSYSSVYSGNNIKYLGLASGKISTYLRYGIPVITNEIGLYADIIREHKIGLVVPAPDDMARQLENISELDMTQNAKSYFAEYLDFNLYSDKLLSNIRSAMKTTDT